MSTPETKPLNKEKEKNLKGFELNTFNETLLKKLEEDTKSNPETLKLLKVIRVLLHSDHIERLFQHDTPKFVISKSNSKLIESYNFKKSLKLFTNSLKQDSIEIPISIDLLKHLESLLSSNLIQLQVNDQTIPISIESQINFNGILLSKALIQALLEDLQSEELKEIVPSVSELKTDKMPIQTINTIEEATAKGIKEVDISTLGIKKFKIEN